MSLASLTFLTICQLYTNLSRTCHAAAMWRPFGGHVAAMWVVLASRCDGNTVETTPPTDGAKIQTTRALDPARGREGCDMAVSLPTQSHIAPQAIAVRTSPFGQRVCNRKHRNTSGTISVSVVVEPPAVVLDAFSPVASASKTRSDRWHKVSDMDLVGMRLQFGNVCCRSLCASLPCTRTRTERPMEQRFV